MNTHQVLTQAGKPCFWGTEQQCLDFVVQCQAKGIWQVVPA